MPIDFPNSPTTNQEFTAAGRTWIYDGAKWVAKLAYGAHGATHAASGTDAVLLEQSQVNTLPATLLGKVNTSTYVAAGKNAVINGALDFWQRGTSFSNAQANACYADRWNFTANGTGLNTTISQDTSVPNQSFKYSIKYTLAANATSILEWRGRQFIEVANLRPLQGKLVTTSFWYKSSIAGSHTVRLGIYNASGSGLDSSLAFGYPVANVWQYVSVVHSCLVGTTGWTVGENGAGAFLDIGPDGASAYASGTYFQFTGVQLEAGSVATPFSRAGGTIDGELAACQRYCVAFDGIYQYSIPVTGWAYSTGGARLFFPLPVNARVVPTSIDYTAASSWSLTDVVNAGSAVTGFVYSSGDSTIRLASVNATVASGLTQYRPYALQGSASASGAKFIFNMEL